MFCPDCDTSLDDVPVSDPCPGCGGNRPVADRFDAFMVSRSARIESIEHNYEDAVAAGSDHAYVCAELSIAE